MPTYDYVCSACGHELEIFQSMKDAPLKKCPKCGKMKLARQIGGGAGLIFKGSGFYETDYKKKSSGSDSKGEKGSSSEKSSDSGKSSSGTSESKPSKSSETK